MYNLKRGVLLLVAMFCVLLCSCFAFGFVFSGLVYNSTYSLAPNAVVYLIDFQEPQGRSPPTEVYNSSYQANATGWFNFTISDVNNKMWKIEVIINGTGENITHVSAPMNPMPGQMISSMMNGMKFYLEPAITLQLKAHNSTGQALGFGYMITDLTSGKEVKQQASSLFNATTVVLPNSKNYTVSFVRSPDALGACTQASQCTPPISFSLNNASAYNVNCNYAVNITQNLSYSQYRIWGYVNASSNAASLDLYNITEYLSVAGFVGPGSSIPLSGSDINNSYAPGSASLPAGYIGFYNISAMGASAGIEQIISFYAANVTRKMYYGWVQNTSITGNLNLNITLEPMKGAYSVSGNDVLTNKTTIALVDGDDGTTLSEAFVMMQAVLPTGFTVRYMASQLTSGATTQSFVTGTNVTIDIFADKFEPVRRALNLTQNTNTITLYKFKMRRRGPGVTESEYGTDEKTTINISFYRNDLAACNVQQPPESCLITRFRADQFNPFKAKFAGKVNMMIEKTDVGHKTYYIGNNMGAGSAFFGDMNDQANERKDDGASSNFSEKWYFGAGAPPTYDQVFVGVKYNQTLMNENVAPNITLDSLYDDDDNLAWNSSTDTKASGLPSGWSDYNVSWFNRSAGGMSCSKTDTSAPCLMNTTTDYLWMNFPHFSGDLVEIVGDTDNVAPVTAANLFYVNDTDHDGNIEINWTDDGGEASETYKIYRGTNIVNTSRVSATDVIVIKSGIAEGTQYYEDTRSVSGTNYWYALVTVDSFGNYNATGNMSSSLNTTANDTIMPKSISVFNATASGSTALLNWTNVTADLSGNTDSHGMRYKVYRGTDINFSIRWVNDTNSGLTYVQTVSTNYTTDSVGASGTYYYVITTIDDAGYENKSIIPGKNNYSVSLTYTSTSSDTASGEATSSHILSSSQSEQSNVAETKTYILTDLKKDATVAKAIDLPEMGITEVKFTLTTDLAYGKLSVLSLKSKPSKIDAVEKEVYQYLEISSSSLANRIKDASVKFKVPKSWISENNIKGDSVVLLRYNEEKWQALKTTKTSEDADNLYFDAVTPGFSYFAISGEKAEVREQANETNEDQPKAVPTGSKEGSAQKTSSALWWVLGIVVVLLIVVVVYAMMTKKRRR